MRKLNIKMWVAVVLLTGLAREGQGRSHDTYEININKKDSSVRANVYNDPLTVKTKTGCTYYWYAYNKIHFTQGGYDGRLLHGEYVCFYPNGNIKQKGNFKDGLKEGEWVSWYDNGVIAEIAHWKGGLRQGAYKNFSQAGGIHIEACYKNDKLNGNYITYEEEKITEKKRYRMGKELLPKEKKQEKKKPVPHKNDAPRENTEDKTSGKKKDKLHFRIFHSGQVPNQSKPKPKDDSGTVKK